MAKQQGFILLRGSLNGKTYFKVKGKYYVKDKSSLDKARFDTDPAFANSRKTANQTKTTAPLASAVYHQLPKKLQKHGIIGKMIGEAGRLLRAGLSEVEIATRLQLKFNPPTEK